MKKLSLVVFLLLFTLNPCLGADINSDLFDAALNGYIYNVKELIDRGADVNSKNKEWQTPLMGAANYGATDSSISSNKYNSETQLQIATCALFLEIANSDDDFSIEEKDFIEKTMREEFNLDDELVTELLTLATQQTDESVSLYEFTDVINKSYGRDEKLIIIKNLWQLVFADGTLDKYEEYFMRTISKNLHLEHSDMIAAKLEAKGKYNK